MRIAFAVYWLIGCLLVGSATAMHSNACPNDPAWTPSDGLEMVAIWPVAIGYGMINPHPQTRCEASP